eukprot:Sspe_Gene.98308::Locus_71746_Transcript_1_2_Confidence_0.400_Length_1572::g.98308::m.98308/K14731/mlhB, chnC; epsilon-lactone hydrolase
MQLNGKAVTKAEVSRLSSFSRELCEDFTSNFLKFLLTVTVICLTLPLGVFVVAIPITAILGIVMPLLAFGGLLAFPVVLLVLVILSFNYNFELYKIKNTLRFITAAVLNLLFRTSHRVLTMVYRLLYRNKMEPSPEMRAFGKIVKMTRQRGKVYTLQMFRFACEGYAILFFYRKPLHHDVVAVPASNPPRSVDCHFLRTARLPTGQTPVLFYLHGGGFVAGSAGAYRGMIAPIATRLNCNVFAVEYRKMPEFPLPAAIEDAVAAYRHLTINKGVSPSNIVFAGDSAGGALCLLTLLAIKKDPLLSQPTGAFLMSPYVDITVSTNSWVRNRGKDFILEPRIIDAAREMFTQSPNFTVEQAALYSPALYEPGALQGLPPLFVSASTAEPLIDEILVFYRKALEAGVDITLETKDNCPHVYAMLYSYTPEGKETMEHGVEFMERCLQQGQKSRRQSSMGDSLLDLEHISTQSM